MQNYYHKKTSYHEQRAAKENSFASITILIEIPAQCVMLIIPFFRKDRQSFPPLRLDIDEAAGESKFKSYFRRSEIS